MWDGGESLPWFERSIRHCSFPLMWMSPWGLCSEPWCHSGGWSGSKCVKTLDQKQKEQNIRSAINHSLQAPRGPAHQRHDDVTEFISYGIRSHRWWPRRILRPGWPHKQSASQRSRSPQEQRWWGGSLTGVHPGLFCFSVERCRGEDETSI